MRGALLIAVLACASAPGAAQQDALAGELRAAIDLPTPKERRAAALSIARRKDATVDGVLGALDAALARDPFASGTHVLSGSIHAGNSIEEVELVVYVPPGYDPAVPAPLIAAFHGTGGTGRGMERSWKETADALGAIVVAPGEAGANEGYAFSLRERDAALGAVRWAATRFAIDPNRVYATGISRGGHLTWDVALRRPDRFAALAPFLGCPRFQLQGGQNNLRFLENVAGVPIRDLQGSRDDPGVLENLHEAFAKLAALHASDAKLIEFPDRGHDFDFAAVDWKDFLAARREPLPERVVFLSANLAEARAYFVEIVQFTKDAAENPRIDVKEKDWEGLDTAGRRRFVQERIDSGTARVEVVRAGQGRFEITARHVAKLRLYLSRDLFDPRAEIEVSFAGRTTKRRVVPDVKVLLTDLVERVDRSFLPIATIEIP